MPEYRCRVPGFRCGLWLEAAQLPHLRGGLQCRLSDAELAAKFVDQTTLSVPGYDARRAMEALWPLQLLEVVAVVARLLAAGLG